MLNKQLYFIITVVNEYKHKARKLTGGFTKPLFLSKCLPYLREVKRNSDKHGTWKDTKPPEIILYKKMHYKK